MYEKSTSFQKYLLAVKKDSLKRSLAWRERERERKKKDAPVLKVKLFFEVMII